MIKILPGITSINGTSAFLLPCDTLTVTELLHGMMLPSGNDAAQALAIHFGLLIMREKITAQIKKAGGIQYVDIWNADIVRLDMKNYMVIDNRADIIDCALIEFYNEMNSQAQKMKLRDSHFLSAHGMHHDKNYSSAHDIAVVSYHCMKNWTFQSIVKT